MERFAKQLGAFYVLTRLLTELLDIVIGQPAIEIEIFHNFQIVAARGVVVAVSDMAVEPLHHLEQLDVAFVPRPLHAPSILFRIGSVELLQGDGPAGSPLQALDEFLTFLFQSLMDELSAKPLVFLWQFVYHHRFVFKAGSKN